MKNLIEFLFVIMIAGFCFVGIIGAILLIASMVSN